MQISKCFLVVCASACCTIVLPLRAAETDSDAKLREALRQKIAELQAQPAPPPASAAKSSPAAAQPMPKPTPPATQATPATTPPPAAAQPVDQQSIDKARATLHQQMTDLENQPPAATAATNPPPKTTGSQTGQKAAQAKPQETAGKPEAEKKTSAKGAAALAPIQAPPPAISADKGARLAELLKKYKAEELTPEEYHRQRTKILNEP